METKKITKKVRRSIKEKILNTIEQHEKRSKSYFWKPNTNAGGRRSIENKFKIDHPSYSFTHQGIKYEIITSLDVSCKNYYYSLSVYVDAEKKNIKTLKKLI
jgi:hypothetical protein